MQRLIEEKALWGANKEFIAPMHGLRGIAVLYVVFSHLGNAGLFLLPVRHQAIGKVGVWIFFSLSAFLLTRHFVRLLSCTTVNKGPIFQYAIHRVFRIYPLYLSILILHVVINNFSLSQVINHLLLMEGWRELWAIPVEFQYYFAIPLIAIISVRMHRRWIYLLISATLVASIIYGVSDPETVFSNGLNIFPKAGPFLMGTTLALLVHHQYLHIHKSSRFMSGMVILVSLSGLTFATVLYQCRGSACIPLDQLPWLSILIGLSVTGLMFSALRANWVSKTLSLKPLVYLGEISFSLYLLHLPVILLVLNYIDLHPAITAWIAFLLSITLASATYWLIERPGMKMGRVLSQRIPLTQ